MLKTLALVLKKQNYGETDRILTVLSPTLGKKRVIARAVRRPLSRLSGHLDTLMLSQLMLTDEDELPKVTAALLEEPFSTVRNSLALTTRAQRLTKLVERVILEDIGQRAVFEVTVEALTRLNQRQSWPTTWLYFLSQLTEALGLGAHNFHCLSCRESISGEALWVFGDRRLVCRRCQPSSLKPGIQLQASSVKLLRLLRQEPYTTVRRVQLPLVVGQTVEEVLLREITEWLNKPWSEYASLARD